MIFGSIAVAANGVHGSEEDSTITLTLTKSEIDLAHKDKQNKIPSDFKVRISYAFASITLGAKKALRIRFGFFFKYLLIHSFYKFKSYDCKEVHNIFHFLSRMGQNDEKQFLTHFLWLIGTSKCLIIYHNFYFLDISKVHWIALCVLKF